MNRLGRKWLPEEERGGIQEAKKWTFGYSRETIVGVSKEGNKRDIEMELDAFVDSEHG